METPSYFPEEWNPGADAERRRQMEELQRKKSDLIDEQRACLSRYHDRPNVRDSLHIGELERELEKIDIQLLGLMSLPPEEPPPEIHQ